MSFNPEWCKDKEQRCEACPYAGLQAADLGVAEHTLRLLSMYEPRDVVWAVNDAEQHYDSYAFEQLVEFSGGEIQTFYGEESGYGLAKAAILRIASAHNLTN